MGDQDDRAAAGDRGEVLLDDRFALGVERAGRLVEDQHRRVVDEGARDRQALALATRQIGRAFLEDCRIALRKPLDEFVRAGQLRDPDDVVQRSGRLGHRDVLANRAAEQKILLQDDTDLGAQMRQIELLQILAVDIYQARLRPIETLDQPGDCRLARAAAADDADNLAGLDGERDFLDRRGRRSRIVKGHTVELDVAADGRGELAARRFGRRLHQLGEELQGQHRALIILHQGGGVDQRLHQPQSQHVEGDERADRHLVAQHEQCAQCANPDAHAAFEAGDDAAGAGRGVVERQALARRLFGMTAPAQHRAPTS